MHCTAHSTVLCTYVYTHQHMVKKWMNEWDNLTLEKKKNSNRNYAHTLELTHVCTCMRSYIIGVIQKYFEFFCLLVLLLLFSKPKRREPYSRNKRSDDTNQTICNASMMTKTNKSETAACRMENGEKRERKNNVNKRRKWKRWRRRNQEEP